MEARFTPTVIAELRHRVIAHNEALPAAIREAALTKLGTLKGLYKRYHNGASPHEHALRKIEAHLDRQRDQALAEVLAKAENRDRRGRFAPGGGGNTPLDVPHRDPNDDPSAPKTQIIPETRYSLFGPIAGSAAGTALGAAVGAGARFASDSPADRLQHRVVQAVGRRAGGGAATLLVRPAANAGIQVARSAVGLVNRTFKTSHKRPGFIDGAKARSVGRAVGERVGRAASHGYALTTNTVPASAKLLAHVIPASYPRTRMVGRGLVGAAAGAVFPGLLMYAPGLHAGAARIGPYLDAAFPRKVRKMVGPLFDAPEVLAKQAEIATLDLQKANLRGIAQAVAREARRFVRTLKPDGASHAVGAGAPLNAPILGSAGAKAGKKLPPAAIRAAHEAAEGAYALHPEGPTKTGIAGTARIVARHTLGLGIGGAAVGGIGGAGARAGYEYFNPGQHPRDAHGRFRSKASSAVQGVKIGGVLGTAAGVAAGLIFARQGRGALLRAAITKLGDAAPQLHAEAETVARTAHAQDYAKANKAKLQNFAPGQVIDKDAVKAALEQKAEADWRRAGGAAMADPQKWYDLQLDQGFDKAVGKQLHALAGVDANGKRVPLTDAVGNTVRAHFLRDLDESKLNDAQKKIWADLKARHEATREQINGIYVERKTNVSHFDAEVKHLEAEKGQLEQGQRSLPNWQREAEDLVAAKAPVRDIRTFMKYRLNIELAPNVKRDDAVEQMRTALNEYEDKSTDRLDEIDRALKAARADHDSAMRGVQADLEDAQRIAVKNPFSTGKKDQYFDPIPDRAAAIKAVREGASKDFVATSDAVAATAKGHLNTLIATRQAALDAGLPKTGMMGRVFHEYAPVVAGSWETARRDAALLMEARSQELAGVPKTIDDFLKTNKDPKTAYATAKAVGAKGWAKGRAGFHWSMAHYKQITAGLGVAAAVGVLDLSNPTRPLKLKGMGLPKGTRLINEPMGTIERPERLLGVVFRDKQTNQEVFASGIHIKEGGKGYTAVPFGTALDSVRNQIRNRSQNQSQPGGGGGQQGPRPPAVPVGNRAALNTVLDQLRKEQHIKSAGPPGQQFQEREGGNYAAAQENDVFDALYKKHLEPLDALHVPKEEANDKAVPFWDSLRELFESHGTQVMNRARRLHFLVGTARRRGIFANPNRVYAGDPAAASKGDVTNQLIQQVGMHTPIAPDEYKQMHRAIWLIANHYQLSDGEKQRVVDALEKHYTNSTAQEPPAAGAAGTTPRNRMVSELAELRQHVVDSIPEAKRGSSWKSDQDVLDFVDKTYRNAVMTAQRQRPNASTEELHDLALNRTRQHFDGLAKAAPEGEGLRKFLKWGAPVGEPSQPKPPGVAPIGASSARPKAFGAPVTPRGGLRVPGAAHQANQATSYILGQGAFDAAETAAHFIPGSGLASAAVRAALPSAAGLYNATQIAPKVGRAVGHTLGDTTEPTEVTPGQMAVRATSGVTGQIAAMKLTHGLTNRAGQAAADHLAQTSVGRAATAAASKLGQTKVGQSIAGAASRAATRAEAPGLMAQVGSKVANTSVGRAASAVGSQIAGAASRAASAVGRKVLPGVFERAGTELGETVGSLGGAVAGTAAEPGAGTLGGKVAGKLIGGVIGGGAGWLTDEAVGYLYRHLGAYHPKVADNAARHLGVPAAARQRHLAAIAGASQRGGTV